ncbi:MAG: YicC family protein [Bacteroidales bacterium]|nr:YicC family protein [Bacteroidales bacterium]
MILSMTGFGKAVVIDGNRKITAEIKSLNSKQLDLAIRLPQTYREIELDLRNKVTHSLERGKVDLYIYTEANDSASAMNLNMPLLSQYKEQIVRMSEELSIPLPVDWYATLLRLPDAIKTDANSGEVEESEIKAVGEAVEKAIEALTEFRTQEGNRLHSFFAEKIANIQTLLGEVDAYEAERVSKIKARIQESLSKLENIDYDQNRFEQEMIFYIEKLDITEEKIRLQNHLNYFLSTMDSGHGQGKKLGFISQEMGREINTLGSKSNHAELQKVVVRMKDELEQIKEQVLNVM